MTREEFERADTVRIAPPGGGEPMSMREAFDRVANHLLTQGEKSVDRLNGEVVCKYRSENGLKCAIGYLIPDDLYISGMEGYGFKRLVADFPHLKKLFRFSTDFESLGSDLLSELQSAHDYLEAELWEKELNRIEEKYFKKGEA